MRSVLCMCALLVAVVLCACVSSLAKTGSAKAKNYILYVGTYTGPESEGIYAYAYDAATGKLTPLGVAARTANPSFLAIDATRRFLYTVNEGRDYHGENSGAVTAFSIGDPNTRKKTGKLTSPSR